MLPCHLNKNFFFIITFKIGCIVKQTYILPKEQGQKVHCFLRNHMVSTPWAPKFLREAPTLY